jgi:hypothetical protein
VQRGKAKIEPLQSPGQLLGSDFVPLKTVLKKERKKLGNVSSIGTCKCSSTNIFFVFVFPFPCRECWRELLKIKSKKSNIDHVFLEYQIKRLCLYIYIYIYIYFLVLKEQPIVDVESSIMLGDSLFCLSPFLILCFNSDSLGPKSIT